MNTKRIKGMFLYNFAIKLFALLFAIVLWMHASTRGQSEVNFVVPLELRNIPKGMAVVGDVPGFVDIRLRGNEARVRGLSSGDVKAGLDLSGEKEGEVGYTLTASDINIPSDMEVVMISPVSIRLTLDAKIRKQLSVKPVLVGEPASGYELTGVRVLPETMGAVGPGSQLKWVEEVATEAVSIQGLKGGLETRVALQRPRSSDIKMDDNHVIVIVSVTPKKDTR